MLSTQSKLRLTGAFAALLILALASCQGFFPHATLTSITLAPSAPSFAVGYTQPMQAWGVDSNNNRYQLTSGVTWSLSAPSSGTVATINTSTGTMTGVNAGTITVQASAQGLSATATATVVEIVTSMTINPLSGNVTATNVAYQPFTITDQNGNNISANVVLTAELNGQAVSGLPCGYELGNSTDTTNDCVPSTTVQAAGTTVTYQIVVSYSGYTGTPVTASLTVTNP
jgi:Bacterial Ig-like domain (group 2)